MAGITGHRAHALMQWQSIAGPGVEAPDQGKLPAAVSLPLRTILASHTDCRGVWLAVWQGYGWDYKTWFRSLDSSKPASGSGNLFRAPLDLMELPFYEGVKQTANMVWSDDRSWCLASEIDLNTTYIGGPAPLIEALLAADDLEVWPVQLDDDVTIGCGYPQCRLMPIERNRQFNDDRLPLAGPFEMSAQRGDCRRKSNRKVSSLCKPGRDSCHESEDAAQLGQRITCIRPGATR